MESQLSRRPVVILGMFRSSTSAVANCFERLGFHLGDEADMFPTDEHNAGGYFEMRDLIQLNRKLLGFFDMRYFRVDEIPQDWRSLPHAESLVIPYESFLDNSAPYLRDATTLLAPNRWTEGEVSAAVQCLRPDWRRNRASERDLGDWTGLVSETFELSLECAVNPVAFRSGHFDDEIEARWNQ